MGVREHAGARAPSFLLTLDIGGRGTADAVLSTGDYKPGPLEGTQVVCRLEAEGPVVVGAHSHGKGLVPLRPDVAVEPGTLVS